ncbi:hypothetical protein FHL15_007908 [Xylaria flabelliformis]|uniref:Uncharacterized protein n=1 Tax=Xylaria flabelliformis TaxID=2512241 RepID=A0A553HT37_9PEZI|nr:hypothetical protein FHL15_007908 [Xylaria flabelliformis]
MSGLRDTVNTVVLPDLNWENQCSEHDSGPSPVQLTPPSASSVGESTPAASDNDMFDDIIGHQGKSDSSSGTENSSTEKFATAIEDVVSSLVRTASPLTRQQVWASVQTIAKDNVARIADPESSWSGSPELTHNVEGCPKQETAHLVCQETSRQFHRAPRVIGRETSLDLQHLGGSRTGQSLPDLYKTRIRALLDNVVGHTWRDPSPELINIKISNGFDSQLEIEVQKYVAYDENALTHRIFRGLEPGTMYPTARSTPFSLRYGTLTTQKIDQYCEKLACDMIFKESLGLSHNSLLNHVILFALEIVRLALRFWAIQAIFFTYPWRIETGGHLVGMFPLQLRGYWNGITLLPRLVNQELDRAFETRMDEIERQILEKLQAAIFKRHRDHWCSIFLSCFILLHSLERDTWNMSAWEYETSGQGSAAWPLRKSPSEYRRQNKHIAEIVATHFKIVNQGSSPLKLNWNKPLNQQLLSNSIPARMFILSIQSDFNSLNSRYKPELCQQKQFARGDPQSLNYIYTKMLFDE